MDTRHYTIVALAAAIGWTRVAGAQRETQPPMPTITETSTAGADSTPMLSDANIVALLDEANVADSEAGAIALPKATRTDVRAFAQAMIGEHHALHIETDQVAKAQHITPALPGRDPFSSPVTDETRALTTTGRGPAFDSTYIAREVGLHKAVIAWAQTAETDATNDALESLIKKATPVLHRHLNRAEAIQKQLKTRTTAAR